MADPIVHITNGIPDVGTGNITTLGQTLLDGANVVLGATTDVTVAAGAAGTINSHLRSISRDLVGGVVLQTGGNVIGSVNQAGAPWSVTGTVAVSGTVTVTGSVAASQSGTWNINNIAGTISLPTGAATAAKQPLPGTAGAPSADVITVQGTASMTALKVDGSAVTQPISGNVGISGNVNCVQVTSPWVTSISGNVTCVQSGNWTSRCVGNAGGIFDFSSVQNAATPGQAILIGAEFNAVPTTITTGNSSPLQLDSAANLLVNVKTSVLPTGAATSANQPTAAAQGSATSGQTGLLAEGAVTTASPTYTTGQTSPLSLDTAGNLRVNVVAGGGAGGTSSTFGSAFPATGTAIGVKDNAGTNMTFLQVNASNALKVDGSAVTQPVSGTFWQATQPVSIAAAVTVQQATAANLNATVTGTVAATQSGNWTSRIVGNAGAILDFVGQNAAAPANSILIGGEFNTTPTTITSGNASPLQLDSSGNLKVNIQAGAGSGGTASTVGAAVPGQGTLAMGSVTTGLPSYTTATANSLSLTTSGLLRVDASTTIVGVNAAQSGTWNISNISGTVSLPTGASTSANQPTNAAQGSTTSGQTGNLMMGAVTTANPTYTTGQTSPLSLDTSGAIRVNVIAGSGGGGTSSSFGSAFPATGTAIGVMNSAATAMTNMKVNASNALVVDGSAVTQPVSGTFWQTTQPVSGTITANQGGTWTVQPGNTANTTAWLVTGTGGTFPVTGTFWQATQPISAVSLPLPTGAATAANQPTPAAIGSTTSGQQGALVFGAVTTAAPTYTTAQSDPLSLTTAGALRVDGSGVTQPVSGTFWQATQPVSGTITANQGGAPWSENITQFGGSAVVTGAGASGAGIPRVTVANDSSILSVQSGTWTVQQGTPPWQIHGNVGWNVADAGNPIKIGGYGTTANPGAVTTGNRVNAIFDKLGKQITVGAIRELKGVQKTSITTTTETTVVTAGAAGVFNDVYAIVVTNKSATAVFVDFRDATAGTVRMTLAAPAGDTRGFTVPVDSAMVQAAAASNWTATVSSAVSSIEISMLFVSNL